MRFYVKEMTALTAIFVMAWLFTGSAYADRETYNIYELQISDAGNDWNSYHYAEIVRCVGGIVTHKFKQRFTLQDPSLGTEWAAIEVRGYPVYPTGIEVGDQVDFDNVYVDEYAGVTVLQYYAASSHVINSSGHVIPDPVPVALRNIRYPAHPEDCERYASMLISVTEEMMIGAMDLGKADDNYELIGAADTAWASDYANTDIDTTYIVESGECYGRYIGVLQRYYTEGEWDYYQLLPRGNDDYTPCGTDVGDGIDDICNTAGTLFPSPNPFQVRTRIPFMLAASSAVRCDIFDLSGRRVATLIDGGMQPGYHEVSWNGCGRSGRKLPTGAYLVRIRTRDNDFSGKISLAH
ncbi:MAG: hypothetical protein KJ970_17670 [Candidatus Eisenbacteria bacterium]|uniref:FlgD/Vpr Ig-like domain-containing protein n=1 Tax=Eiseniibacteriota bacterium TaxID=2212470 RepID=A0A948S2R7_UNCEI|nr:hypothetical protein [Candidatus Eisenbacteria bacterium]MBU1951239.1 hypothetical protein [Candidatus Eisenbacteria bacterium]MBU2692749.1 hypothetical protein [Candidatus Eisenbacteria bacterium]